MKVMISDPSKSHFFLITRIQQLCIFKVKGKGDLERDRKS
jgi:hypothetical protein